MSDLNICDLCNNEWLCKCDKVELQERMMELQEDYSEKIDQLNEKMRMFETIIDELVHKK